MSPELSSSDWGSINFFLNTFLIFVNVIFLGVFAWHIRDLRVQVSEVRSLILHRTHIFLDLTEAMKGSVSEKYTSILNSAVKELQKELKATEGDLQKELEQKQNKLGRIRE